MIESIDTVHMGLFFAAVLVLNATPGADMLYTLARTLQYGRRAGFAAALGILSGCVVHTLAAAFGLAALLSASATAFTAVRWAGAVYLLWLAVGMLRSAHQPPVDTPFQPASRSSPWSTFRQGMLINVLNPKVALFFLAFLPQFISPGAPHKTLAFLVLGGLFIVQSLLFLSAFVLLVTPLRHWRPGPSLRKALSAAGAALFAGLAVRLAASER